MLLTRARALRQTSIVAFLTVLVGALLGLAAVPAQAATIAVSGTVASGGVPLGGVSVSVSDVNQVERFFAQSRDDGTWTVILPRAGTYSIGLAHPEHAPQFYGGGVHERPLLDVPVHGLSGLHVDMTRGARLIGLVRDEAGDPVPGAAVGAYPKSQGWRHHVVAYTGPDGRYSLRVHPEVYKLQVEKTGFRTVFHPDSESLDGAHELTLLDQEDYAIDLVLATPIPLANLEAPVVSGTPQVGQVLFATSGTWARAPQYVGYQWLRDGVEIVGATRAGYEVVDGDLGARLSVVVRAVRDGYLVGSAPSLATDPVAARAAGNTWSGPPTPPPTQAPNPPAVAPPAPLPSKAPVPKGQAAVGKKLTVKITPMAGVEVRIQWFRDGKKIKKATKMAYKVTPKDRGRKISYQVTYLRGSEKKVVNGKAQKVKGR